MEKESVCMDTLFWVCVCVCVCVLCVCVCVCVSMYKYKGCEFLEKLDLTVNFVDDLLSVESLRDNRTLQEL